MLYHKIMERAEPWGECLLWTGPLNNQGYGRIYHKGKRLFVHRAIFVSIPDGLVVDHLCHNADPTCPGGTCKHRRCVNPEHLAITTQGENTSNGRKRVVPTTCRRGHPWPKFLVVGKRQNLCRECARLRSVAFRRRQGAREYDPDRCFAGHDRTPENTYVRPDGWRECVICRETTKQRFKAKQ